jgi:hypothetical protein
MNYLYAEFIGKINILLFNILLFTVYLYYRIIGETATFRYRYKFNSPS